MHRMSLTVAVALLLVGCGGSSGSSSGTTQKSSGSGGGNVAEGKKIFEGQGCAGCHTLADAGAGGKVGPNLDQLKPSVQVAVDFVTNGRGAMPPFKGKLSDAQIQDVAQYVASVAGK